MVIPRAIIRDLHTGVEATRLMSLDHARLQRVADPGAAHRQRAHRSLRLARGLRGRDDRRRSLAIVLVAFFLPETHPPERRVPRQLRRACSAGYGPLLRDRHFLGLTFIGGLGMSSFFAFLASSSFIYIEHFGLTPTQYSLAFSVNAIGFIGSSQFAARLGARFGLPRVIVDRRVRLRAFWRSSCSR